MKVVTFLPYSELLGLIRSVAVTVDDELYVSAERLREVLAEFVSDDSPPALPSSAPHQAAESHVPLEVASVTATTTPDDDLEAERARLAALPPGPCVGCGVVHPGSRTEKCDDYVDRTVRDPIQARIDRGVLAAPDATIAPMYQPEPVFDPGSRPAIGSHRPPVNG